MDLTDHLGRVATHVRRAGASMYEVYVGSESIGMVSAPSDDVFLSPDGFNIPIK